ncbi:uncharacterized protein THITE_2124083 [Thermothielavioides terrestris NRRL 8126]|uniref:Myb-like DNA-binding domain-containing protein n=1 Tax=Thermothielavioides terrestris (strain ATCC 38088 / NRRL 8126) TaxID=578455 RepID=G2RI95_THETT|nr:uncharacterized protein THITE_2124083 [Thermothielavioides terrestris NRRL 8126]AEO71557.1 hypothetical protein THITE_2124083 [Thermothielavioides terrestris NRRL 8126]
MANNDNAMARFLFAILQQKCLKDIDWNKVAHNPILAQEITNGHAARMRYSRFRAAMLGLEPQRRNRTNPDKSRVSKKKKADGVKPKKEDDDEKKSGSGIGNIKTEKTAEANSPTTIKSEGRSIAPPAPQPSQPPAPMMTPAMLKTEASLDNPFNQQGNPPSILAAAASSPRIKQEQLPPPAASITPPMPEPTTFGLVSTTPATSSASSTPYVDSHHRMQMRLLTPCSDTDPVGIQGFFPQSPAPSTSDLLHSQHHHHSHHHHHPTVGAGSPPLSAAAPSPYDFSQCLEAAGPPSPWHSQQPQQQHHHPHHQHHHHSHSQGSPSLYSFGPTPGTTTGTAGGFTTLDGSGYNPFCADHHHHHGHDEDADHVVDPLGLHAGAGMGMASNLFREREFEMEMDRATAAVAGAAGTGSGGGDGVPVGSQMVKHEHGWDGAFGGI